MIETHRLERPQHPLAHARRGQPAQRRRHAHVLGDRGTVQLDLGALEDHADLARAAGDAAPNTDTLPALTGSSPTITCNNVLLPAAVGPITAVTTPSGTSRSTSLSARREKGVRSL